MEDSKWGRERYSDAAQEPKKNADTGSQGSNILSAFQTHHLSLKRFIGRYLNSAQDIEDVSQEAFMRAFSAEKDTEVRQNCHTMG